MAQGRREPSQIELHQFDEICELLRHYSGLRFRQVTIFAAINGGLLILLFRYNEVRSLTEVLLSVFFGIISAFVFFLLEMRLYKYWRFHRNAVEKFEKAFVFEVPLYLGRPEPRLIRGRTAIHIFILGAGLFWLIVLIGERAGWMG